MTTSENLDAPQAKAMSKNDLLILAERLTVMRDYVEAATTWAKLKPFTEPMHAFKYVTCLLGAGLMTEAENSLVESLEIFPNRYDLHRLYAQRLVARDEMERAARHYNYLRNRWQNLESAWLDEIKILLSLKRDQQARDLLATAVTIFPDSMECARLHAESECKKHDWVEALKKWSIFRQKFSSSPIGWRRAIDICVSHRDFVEADRLASEMHSDSIAISGSFFIRKKQGSPHVLIIFSAFDIKLGDWPGGQKFCDPKRYNANIIIINDVRKNWYMDGIYGLGDDYLSSAQRLNEIKDSLLGNNGICICYGNSMGGYGAFLYGGLINADICFAPGLQAFAPNPIGIFKKYNGRRIRLEEVIKKSSHTLFHAIAGEEFLGDIFGYLRLNNLTNIYVETIKNFGHGVTGYVHIKYGIANIINYYFKTVEKYRFKNGNDYIRESKVCDCVNKKDKGSILNFRKELIYLYSSKILLSQKTNKPALVKRINKIYKLITTKKDSSYIYGYLYRIISSMYDKIGDIDSCIEFGRKSLLYNSSNPYMYEFLSVICYKKQLYNKAIMYAISADHFRQPDINLSLYEPLQSYAILLNALNDIKCQELALEIAENYQTKTGFTKLDLKNINEARKRCLDSIEPRNIETWDKLRKGDQGWRWYVLADFYERAGDFVNACEAMRRAVQRRQKDNSWRLKYIDLLRAANKDDEAFEFAMSSVKSQRWGAGYRRLSQISYARNNMNDAMRFAVLAKEAEPVNAFHDLQLSLLYREAGNFLQAEKHVRDAMRDERVKKYALREMNAIEKKDTNHSVINTRKAKNINEELEINALFFELDFNIDSNKEYGLRLKLASLLKKKSFIKALAVIEDGLKKHPSWQEGLEEFKKIKIEQSNWIELHQSRVPLKAT